jgi:hypothetical protein
MQLFKTIILNCRKVENALDGKSCTFLNSFDVEHKSYRSCGSSTYTISESKYTIQTKLGEGIFLRWF